MSKARERWPKRLEFIEGVIDVLNKRGCVDTTASATLREGFVEIEFYLPREIMEGPYPWENDSGS